MDILMVMDHSSFGRSHPTTGGQITTNSLIRYFAKNYDVGLVCGGKVPPRDDEDMLSAVHFLGEPSLPLMGIGKYFRKYALVRSAVEKLIDRCSPRLVISQGQVIPAAVEGATHCRVPCIGVVRGYENLSVYPPVQGRIPSFIDYRSSIVKRYLKCARDMLMFPLIRWYLYKNREMLRAATQVVTNSNYMATIVEREIDIESNVIYPHVHCEPTMGEGEGIGFISPKIHKGSRIAAELADLTQEYDYKWFGARDDATRDMNLPSNVSYKGWREDVSTIYSEIELLIVPSQWPEPFGRIAAEALQAGVPCVASNTGGLAEVLGDSGVLVSDYRDVEEWCRVVRKVMGDPELRGRITKDGRRRGRNRFSEEVLLPQWGEMISGVIE